MLLNRRDKLTNIKPRSRGEKKIKRHNRKITLSPKRKKGSFISQHPPAYPPENTSNGVINPRRYFDAQFRLKMYLY